MTRGQSVVLHVAVALLSLTGAVFAWMKYGMTSDDPFAVANHPWQPHMLAAHVLAAPFAVFGIGWIFASHIRPRWSTPPPTGRRSGSASLFLIAPMILTGYLLQVGSNEAFHQAMRVTHWVASGLFAVGYLVHVFRRRLPKPVV